MSPQCNPLSTCTISIKHENAAGAFAKPNGMTFHLKSPSCGKGSFCSVLVSHRPICQYPLTNPRVLNHSAPARLSIVSLILGKLKESFLVTSLSR